MIHCAALVHFIDCSVFYPVFNFVFLWIFCVVVLVLCAVLAASWRNKD